MLINKVIAGDYQGQNIKISNWRMYLGDKEINKETVEHYEILNENSSTTSITKGNTKNSMIGGGAKGAVGAVIGTAIAPGIGTLIGAGAGVNAAKGKNKSVTKEVTTKEITVAIHFTSGEQSLVKMDGDYYEEFLASVFSEQLPPLPAKTKKQKDPAKNKKVLKALGWIFIPYIMIFVFWKRLSKQYRILGTTWAVIAILTVFLGR